jgi:hypothetical protein
VGNRGQHRFGLAGFWESRRADASYAGCRSVEAKLPWSNKTKPALKITEEQIVNHLLGILGELGYENWQWTAPETKLKIAGGNILVGSPGKGIILEAPGGTCKLLSIDNAGPMVLSATACP